MAVPYAPSSEALDHSSQSLEDPQSGKLSETESKQANSLPTPSKGEELHVPEVEPSYISLVRGAVADARTPELHGTHVASAIEEINYQLSFDPDAAQNLIKLLSTQAPVVQLDTISLLESVGRTSAANGSWSRPAMTAIESALTQINAQAVPLVRAYATIVINRLNQEKQDPTLSVIKHEGDPNYGRVSVELANENWADHNQLWHSIRADETFPQHARLQTIASDAIAITDQGLIPQQLAKVDRPHLRPSELSDFELQQLEQAVQSMDTTSDSHWLQVISYLNNKILAHLPADSSQQEVLHEVFSSITSQEWQALIGSLASSQQISKQIQQQQAEQQQQVEQANLQLTSQFVDTFINNPQLEQSLISDDVSSKLSLPHLHAARQALQLNDLEEAFSQLVAICSQLQRKAVPFTNSSETNISQTQLQPIQQQLVDDFKTLRDQHVANFTSANGQNPYQDPRIATSLAENRRVQDTITKKIKHNAADVKRDLLHYMQSLRTSLSAELPLVKFQPLGAALTESQSHSLGNHPLENPDLLIQRLHEAGLKEYIQTTLGVKLSDIQLSSQLYLLKFMLEADQIRFTRLQQTLAKQPDQNKILLLESFLALEMGDEFGDILLSIAETVSPEQIQDILSHVESIRAAAHSLSSSLTKIGGGEAYGRGINLAIVKRTTEVLSVIPDLANGIPVEAHARYQSNFHPVQISQIEHPVAALTILDTALQAISGDLQATPTRSSYQDSHDSALHHIEMDRSRITIRPHESAEGEARLSFKVVIPQSTLVALGFAREQDRLTSRERSVTIKLDLEKRTGKLALDMGVIEVKDEGQLRLADTLLGLVITAGAEKINGGETNNHVREAFSPDLANPDRLAQYLQNLIDALAA